MPKPSLTVVRPGSNAPAPHAKLNAAGRSLWDRISNEYLVSDAGGLEILQQAAEVADLIAGLKQAIARDGGPVIKGRGGPRPHPAIKDLLSARSLLARLLGRLGVLDETVKSVGRPPMPTGWTGDDEL